MPPENEVSLRDTLETAFDEHTEQTGGSTENAPESVRVPAEAATTPAVTPIPTEDRGDGRRVDGKFARKAAEQPNVDSAADGATGKPAAVASVAAVDTGKPVDAFAKAPQSWKPGAREAWGQLPPDVRAEVHRRERETQRVVAETAQARQVASHVESLSQKFAPALQAEGVDVIKATENLMNLASRLRFGTPNEKAQLAAQIIRSYGVDISQLDQVLSGAAPTQQQQQPQMMTDPRVDQLLAQLQGLTTQRQQAVVQKAVGEVETFGSDKEFFADVREDMADLMEVAARRGIDLTLEQAYERACAMQPEIHKVLAAREAARLAGNQNGSTQRARHAASSVRGTPSGMPSSQPSDLRGAIESAIETVGGR
jgi:hypothetical protein